MDEKEKLMESGLISEDELEKISGGLSLYEKDFLNNGICYGCKSELILVSEVKPEGLDNYISTKIYKCSNPNCDIQVKRMELHTPTTTSGLWAFSNDL